MKWAEMERLGTSHATRMRTGAEATSPPCQHHCQAAGRLASGKTFNQVVETGLLMLLLLQRCHCFASPCIALYQKIVHISCASIHCGDPLH